MCPLTVASLLGKCLVTSFVVSPGNVDKKPLLIAVINVDLTGNRGRRDVAWRGLFWLCRII